VHQLGGDPGTRVAVGHHDDAATLACERDELPTKPRVRATVDERQCFASSRQLDAEVPLREEAPGRGRRGADRPVREGVGAVRELEGMMGPRGKVDEKTRHVGGYAVAGSYSATAVRIDAGGRTQVASLFAAVLGVLTVFFAVVITTARVRRRRDWRSAMP
jgi:hypothetical protein